MNKLLLILIFWGYTIVAIAQDSLQTYTFTLDQCIEYAYANAASVRKANLDIESAKARVGEIRGIGLPQINGQAQFNNNFDPQKQFIPAFGDQPLSFQTRYGSTAGVTLTQLIFDGSYFVGLQAAKTYKELAARNFNLSKIEIAANVTKAYYGALVNQERFGLVEQNEKRLDSLLRETKAMFENGFVEKIDLSRLEVTYNNLKVEKQKIQRGIELSVQLLKFQMGMPVQDSLALTEKIKDLNIAQITIENTKADYRNRTEYSLLETQRLLSELDMKNVKSGFFPRLAFVTSMGFNSNGNTFKQLSDRWLSNGFWGLNLNVPIFDGLQKSYKVQQNKISLKKLEEDRKSLERTIDFQVNQAQVIFKNSADALIIQKRNLELAEEVVKVSKIKYQQGVGSNLEVLNAETSYKEAETNYFNALYDALISKVDVQQALGNLGK